MRVASATVALAIVLCAALVSAQADRGQIRGTLSGARGPIANAEVRVKNTATEQVTVATTSHAGEFSVAVPAGTYDVFSSTVGYAVLARRGVMVTPGATVRVDAKLADNANAGTPGEIFFLYARAEKKPPTGPAPRTRDGKPDLSGVWYPVRISSPRCRRCCRGPKSCSRSGAPRWATIPRAQCLPSGIVRTHGLDLAKLVQTPDAADHAGGKQRARHASGVPRRASASARRAAVVAGPLSGSVGGGHAGHRHHRTERPRVAGPDGPATDREGAHHRALPASRPRAPGGRDHHRRSRSLHHGPGRSAASWISRREKRSSSTSATRITRRNTS